MLENEVIEEFIGLKGVIINDIVNDKEYIEIHLKLEQKEHICPKCSNKVNRVQDYYSQKLRDLDILGKRTYIN